MKNVVRWTPSREFGSLWNALDRMLDDSYMMPSDQVRNWGLALDVSENDNAYVVQASVPGIDPKDISVTIEKNVLTISGETQADESINSEEYRLRERRYGTFSRSLRFPVEVSADSIEANYERGVLTLIVPKTEEVRPKKIAVNIKAK